MSEKVNVTRVDDGVARVQMDDPGQQNQLSDELVDGLLDRLRDLAEDTSIRAVILAGREDVFCGGGTLELLQRVSSGDLRARDVLLPAKLVEFPVPIIAAVEGHAVGAGLAVALYCDIVVASEGARYGANFTSMGFTPGLGVTSLLPALVGHGFASEMMMTAKFYKGAELARRGLFTHVVAAREVLPLATDLARRIAERPRHVLTMLKADLAIPRRRALVEATSREHLMHELCFSRPEARALIDAAYIGPRPEPPARTPGDAGQ
ncbi:MAG TPA: polyketide synthase [Candidatus Nanopelagicales bacterium]|nr:polyketide synthase [Candidatus Nanopelagicales bacterium]